MATKVIQLAGIGQVTLMKRAQSRTIRLSITPSGIRVSMPRWTPFSAGKAFAESHQEWIMRELAKQSSVALESGQKVGKLHYVRFEQVLGGQSITARVTATEVIVRMQHGEVIADAQVQERARLAVIRALKREAERLLPPRLASLAEKYQKSFTSVSIKQLKRRWGSCDSHQAITLNLFLMELPWDYIDYVLLHELTHTVEMNHGPNFWKLLVSMEPRACDLSRQLRTHQPVIGGWQPNR